MINSLNPLVSIIIPCYNYEKYIEQCIQSALDQTYKNIEVIVVDNGSTDNSLKKINTFKNNAKVKIIKLEKNIPPGTIGNSAFKIAFKASKGEYIGILYADDWYIPNKIERQLEVFNTSDGNVGVVYCHGFRFYEKEQRLVKWKYQSVSGYVFKDYLLKGDVVIPISPLVKRYCYDIIGVENIFTGSEYDYLAMSQYVNFNLVDDYMVAMRDHDSNDAKSVYSVYDRLIKYHSKLLLSDNAKSRAGVMVNKRIAIDCLSFGLTFVTMMDLKKGRYVLIKSFKLNPYYLFNLNFLFGFLLTMLPNRLSRFAMLRLNKLKSN